MTEPALTLDFSFPDLVADLLLAGSGTGPVADAVTDTMYAGVSLLAGQISALTPVNIGVLSGAIAQAQEVQFGRGIWEGVVSDGGVAYAEPVEYGQKPGGPKARPSKEMVDSIEFWVKRKGLGWSRTLKSGKQVPLSTRSMAWAIATHIRIHGKEGVFMFQKGFDASVPHIERMLNDLMVEIGQMWAGKGS